MRRLLVLLCVVLLSVVLLGGCGSTPSNPNDGSGGTQITDSFKLTYSRNAGEFSVARGATEPFIVTVNITKPDVVEKVKVTLSTGPGVDITPSSEAELKNGQSYTFNVSVLNDTTQLKPFFNFVAEGIGEGSQELIQARFQWTIE
jgi:hypothetical protein